MDSYYCIVNLPGVPVRDICVLDASNDQIANQALEAVARNWIGFETLYLYCGERLVTVLSNPALGFAAPLPDRDLADLDLADIRFATAA
ncbi:MULTISPECIES: hypothetical protein [unclassified Brevundimonas]|uniref:hypothetical protein n=1 Tax=unclassified Brevundimonas TaxID=2622653 RepID=UPI000E9CF474|nr:MULTISPECIES: hypothetical protein [unclassified Brevundimonas]MCK6105788.1 hypothetical protein [Brevundimonas sp. EYE_349]HBI19830.1 hypothetical protein [Brevundimonas sp.]